MTKTSFSNWYSYSLKIEARAKASSCGWSSIDLPPNLTKQIHAFQKTISEEDIYTTEEDESGWNYGLEPDSHITLLYGFPKGTEFSDFKKLIEDFEPFEIQLGGTSFFENEKYDVLKIDVIESPDLHQLNTLIDENIPNENKYPEYKPHVTISYLKKGKGKDYSTKEFKGKKFTCDLIKFETWDNEKNSVKLN